MRSVPKAEDIGGRHGGEVPGADAEDDRRPPVSNTKCPVGSERCDEGGEFERSRLLQLLDGRRVGFGEEA